MGMWVLTKKPFTGGTQKGDEGQVPFGHAVNVLKRKRPLEKRQRS